MLMRNLECAKPWQTCAQMVASVHGPTIIIHSPLRCCRILLGGDDEKKGLKANSPTVFTALKTFWRTILYIGNLHASNSSVSTLSFGRGIGGGDRRTCCVYGDFHRWYIRTLKIHRRCRERP